MSPYLSTMATIWCVASLVACHKSKADLSAAGSVKGSSPAPAAPIVPPPVFTLGGEGIELASSSGLSQRVLYTLDGSDPAIAGKPFSKPLTPAFLEGVSTIRSIAVNDKGVFSSPSTLSRYAADVIKIYFRSPAASAGPTLSVHTVAEDKDADGVSFGCTGLAYDSVRRRFFVGIYHYELRSAIAIRLRDNTLVKELDVSSQISHIQGLAYDSETDTIYAWGMPPGIEFEAFKPDPQNPLFSRNIIIRIHSDGTTAGPALKTPVADGFPGMMVFDARDRTLWLKANTSSMARQYEPESMRLVREVDLHVRGEGFGISMRDGSFWVNNGKYLYHIAADATVLRHFLSPATQFESEGLVVDPDDDTIWFTADEYLHGRIPGGNRLWHVDPRGTFARFLTIPTMVPWHLGRMSPSLETFGNDVLFRGGMRAGTWFSPVIDTHDLKMQEVAVRSPLAAYVRYRGSNDPPSGKKITDYIPVLYTADAQGNDWPVATAASKTWSEDLPKTRYVQLAIELTVQTPEPKLAATPRPHRAKVPLP